MTEQQNPGVNGEQPPADAPQPGVPTPGVPDDAAPQGVPPQQQPPHGPAQYGQYPGQEYGAAPQYGQSQYSGPQYGAPQYSQSQYQAPYAYPYGQGYPEQKSRLVGGLLGILLGGLGIHRFYLGHIGVGIAQIIVTFVTLGFGAVWGFIEGIMILVGADPFKVDAKGVPLKE